MNTIQSKNPKTTLDRPIRDLPAMILKVIGIAVAALVIVSLNMAEVGLLRPVVERTHQFIPFVGDPACGDVRLWYSDVEEDQNEIDKQFDLIMEKPQPTRSDFDLAIKVLTNHRQFLIDSDPPDEALRLRGQYLEATDFLIFAFEAMRDGDYRAANSFLDDGDAVSALIDQETDRINEKCDWNK